MEGERCKLCEHLELNLEGFIQDDLSVSWKNSDVFTDISVAADPEIGFAKALTELPSRLVMVVLEWK
jgi:hypothetical protein